MEEERYNLSICSLFRCFVVYAIGQQWKRELMKMYSTIKIEKIDHLPCVNFIMSRAAVFFI